MKRLNFFLLGLAAMGMVTFTSCEPEGDAIGPSLQITSGEDVEAVAGSVTIAWRADAGDAKLATITIKEGNAVVNDGTTTWDAVEIPNASNETYVGSVTLVVTKETTFTIVVADKDGLTESKNVHVTVASGGAEISSFTAVLMGAQSATTGSSLDAEAGTVYKLADAKTNASKVDIMYYYGATNLATFAAPNDATVNGTGAGSFDWTSTWSVQNATKFGVSTMTATAFDAITDDSALTGITGLTASKLTNLSIGNVLEFTTVGGKKGVLKVSAITTGASGSITIDVKVQK